MPSLCDANLASETSSEVEATDSHKKSFRVGVKLTAPFVMYDENTGELIGFSIDIIREILADLKLLGEVEFVVHDGIDEHLDAVARGDVDLGIAGTSVTSERERRLDFSMPMFNGGLGVATKRQSGLSHAIEGLFTRGLASVALLMVCFLLVCANLVWWTERGEEHSFDDRWYVGVGQALWWTVVTMTTVGYGDFVPRKALSRLLSILVILVGVVLFGSAVGAFTSALTVKKIQSGIRAIEDFDGKTVAVVSDSIGKHYMASRPTKLLEFADLDGALEAVEEGRASGVVHDFSILRYHLRRHDKSLVLGRFTIAGHGYAIAFPLKSGYRKEVNVALLELMEENPSRYARIKKWWFD
ncbi:MAG: transporter substrate-binding domain-containing protein [Planctomycetaceae bacterium]|nr:transporter substrate-binding domain-containing protein [Planctomycetaceae bacterium]